MALKILLNSRSAFRSTSYPSIYALKKVREARFFNKTPLQSTVVRMEVTLVSFRELEAVCQVGYQETMTTVPCVKNFLSLALTMLQCRQAQWKAGFLDISKGLRSEGGTAIIGMRYTFPESTSPHQSKCLQELCPTMTTKLVYCGKSSFEINSVLHLDSTNIPLVQQVIKYVLVTKHGKSNIPNWFHDKFGCNLNNQSPLRFQELNAKSVRRELFANDFFILPSHIDRNGHANHMVYIEIVLESICKLFQDEKLSFILKAPLSAIDVYYAGESLVGDDLKIMILEYVEDGQDMVAAKIAMKKSNSVIFHMRIAFKDNSVVSNTVSKL